MFVPFISHSNIISNLNFYSLVLSVNPVQSVPLMVAAPSATLHHQIAQHAIQQHQQQQQQQHHHHQQQQQQAHQQQLHHQLQQEEQQEDESEESHLKDDHQDSDCGEQEDSQMDNEEFIEEEHPEDEEEEDEEEDEEEQQQVEIEETFYLSDCESDDEEKQLGIYYNISQKPTCLLSDISSAEFMAHQTSCPSPGRYVCNLCRKEFSQPKWLQTHMSSHSNWLKVKFICF